MQRRHCSLHAAHVSFHTIILPLPSLFFAFLTENVNVIGREGLERLIHEELRPVLGGDGGLDGRALDAIVLLKGLRERLGAAGGRVADVVEGDVGAVAGQGDGDAGADAVLTTGAGDDGDLALEREWSTGIFFGSGCG
jgi:hypothetical protein